jgi:RNase P/RNase MRP subunit POP5
VIALLVRTIRRRYIAFRTVPSLPYTRWQLQRVLLTRIPDREARHAHRLRVVEYDAASGYGILHCGHTHLAETLRLLTATRRELGLESIGVSGTLKALRRKFLPSTHGTGTPSPGRRSA